MSDRIVLLRPHHVLLFAPPSFSKPPPIFSSLYSTRCACPAAGPPPQRRACNQVHASARNLNPGSTALRARCDRGWPRPTFSHTVRKASENQTTSGTGQGVDLQPSFHRDEMDQPFQCLGYRPLTLSRLDWRLLTGKPIVNTARSPFSSPLLPARQGFVYQYIEAVPRASMPLNDYSHMTAS